MQADPLGLVDGASVYGYARGNPGRWSDPSGQLTLSDAVESLRSQQKYNNARQRFSQTAIFEEWLRLELANQEWLQELLDCPCELEGTQNPNWQEPRIFPDGVPFHPGAYYDVRSVATSGGHGSQCTFDKDTNLISAVPGAGSADYVSFSGYWGEILSGGGHYYHDVDPFFLAESLGRVNEYYSVRPTEP